MFVRVIHSRTPLQSLTSETPQIVFFSFTLYKRQEHNPVDSIATFISTHKAYENLVPTMLAEGGEQEVKINTDIAADPPLRHLANATLFMLSRNSEVDGAVNSVREVEDKFNRKYGYPWVFLNEEPFSDNFMRCALSLHLFLAVPLGFATLLT
jgi:hypothetical protein